jgi:hypothetical protein
LAALAVPAFSQSDPDHDFQIWNENTFVVPAFKRTKDGKQTDLINLLILQTNRFGGDGIQPIDARIGIGADVIVNKYLTLTPSYLYRASRVVPTVWTYEHRVRFDATVGYSWKNIGIKNRTRIERRINNSLPDVTRYRNRTSLRVPIKRNDKTIFDIFGTIEPFYNKTARQWPFYEFTSGISTHLSHSITADFFYLHRGEIQILPQTVNGFGVNVRIRLGK